MVDVGGKENAPRYAAAQALVTMKPTTLGAILAHGLKKGDVFACARLAGIMAAKRTAEWIPLCHPIPLDNVEVSLEPRGDDQVQIISKVRTVWRTGVEMEAMTAVSAGASASIPAVRFVPASTARKVLPFGGCTAKSWRMLFAPGLCASRVNT